MTIKHISVKPELRCNLQGVFISIICVEVGDWEFDRNELIWGEFGKQSGNNQYIKLSKKK